MKDSNFACIEDKELMEMCVQKWNLLTDSEKENIADVELNFILQCFNKLDVFETFTDYAVILDF